MGIGTSCGTDLYSGNDSPDARPDSLVVLSTGGTTGQSTLPVASGGTGAGGASGGASGTVVDAGASNLPALPDTGVGSPDLAQDLPAADAPPDTSPTYDYILSIAPIDKLDLVFMIDNSPSMSPKVAKLNAQLSKLFASLKRSSDGSYPDLRIAFIDSDLGTGGAYSSGSCGPNDSNAQSYYGDLGNFQMRGGTTCGMSSADALWIEYTNGAPVNYAASGAINSIAACLATNLGTLGCGEEHSLQSFEFALNAANLHTGAWAAQSSFLRPEATLGLVFLSDEDDCSAATNDGMFGDKAELRGESASLRCATRAHACGGLDLSDNGPGYPTSSAFSADFATCAARTDACSNPTDSPSGAATDTSVPTTCSPLKDIAKLAAEIKSLKGDQASEKILVAGIFGWPLAGSDGKADFSTAEPYKIDRVPNPNSADTAHPQIFDYWPLCYDPDHRPAQDGSYDATAWAYGAQGGLRLSAFLDQFGASALKYSACERDFSAAMSGIGSALAQKLGANQCVPAEVGQTGTCTVKYLTPLSSADGGANVYREDPNSLPTCPADAASGAVAQDCYTLSVDANLCPGSQRLVQVLRTAAELAAGPLPDGTKLKVSCQ